MAGDYIPFDHDFPEKPEVITLSQETGVTVGDIMLLCHRLWRQFDRHTPDGFLANLNLKGVSILCGGMESFWEEVVAIGWLVVRDGGLEMPRFNERLCGKRGCAYTRMRSEEKLREAAAERQRRKRVRDSMRNGNATNDVTPPVTPPVTKAPQNQNHLPVTNGGISPMPPFVGTNGKPKRKKREPKPIVPHPPELLDWYRQYPKHRQNGPGEVVDAYPKAVAQIVANHPEFHGDYDTARAWLRQKTIEFAISPAGNDGEKTPKAATWLIQGRYEADPSALQVTYTPKEKTLLDQNEEPELNTYAN